MSKATKIYRLRDILKVAKSPIDMKDEEEYMLASIRRRNGGMFDRETKKGKQILTKTLNKVIPGSFVISKMQVVHGACSMAPLDFGNRCISASYVSLLPREPQIIDISYLDAFATTRQSYDAFLRASHGVHIEKMTFNLEEWLDGEIELPPLPEQKKIAEILTGITRQIDSSRKQISMLELAKKSLITHAAEKEPERFPLRALREISSVVSGYAFSSSDLEDTCDGIPVIRMSNLKGGEVNYESALKIRDSKASGLERFQLKQGDLLIGMSGSITNTALVNCDRKALLNQRVGALRAKREGDCYPAIAYQSEIAMRQVERMAAGGAQLNISARQIESVEIPMPPTETMNQLTTCWLSIDRVIRLHARKLDKLQALKTGLSTDLLSGRKRVSV